MRLKELSIQASMKLHEREYPRRKDVRLLGFILVILLKSVTFADGNNLCHGLCHTSACRSCEVGYGVLVLCHNSIHTVCEQCVAGVNYSDTSDPFDYCINVSKCEPNERIVIPATSSNDIYCDCEIGYRRNSEGGYCERIPSVSTRRPTQRSTRKGTTSPPVASSNDRVTVPSSSVSSRSTFFPTSSRTTSSSPDISSSSVQHTSSVSLSSDVNYSSMVTSPVANASESPFDKENAGTSSAVIVAGVCVGVVVFVTALVVIVAFVCCRYIYGRKPLYIVPLPDDQGFDDNHIHYCCVGSRYELTAGVDVSGSCLPWKTNRWLKDGAPLQSSRRVVIQKTAIIFNKVEAADGGKYSFINKDNVNEQEIELFVTEDLQPSYNTDEGKSITLKYVVHGTKTTWNYQWYRDGGPLDSSDDAYSGETTSMLTIANVTGRSRYWCVANNDDLTLQSTTTSVIANDVDETVTPTVLSERDPGLIGKITHYNERRRRGTAFFYVENLTQKMIFQLSISMQTRDYPNSLLIIAESLEVNVDKLKSRICTTNRPALFILQELRNYRPKYTLSALCDVFYHSERPECARKLYTLLKESGGDFSVPDWVTADAYSNSSLLPTPTVDEVRASALEREPFRASNSNMTRSCSFEDYETDIIVPETPPPFAILAVEDNALCHTDENDPDDVLPFAVKVET